jgi:hypothetical protein
MQAEGVTMESLAARLQPLRLLFGEAARVYEHSPVRRVQQPWSLFQERFDVPKKQVRAATLLEASRELHSDWKLSDPPA